MNDPEAILEGLGSRPDVAPGVRPTTTFAGGEFSYRRSDHPGLRDIERVAADLEGGVEALAFSSGMGAIVTLFETLPPGTRVLAPTVCYHGSREWFEHLAHRGAIDLRLVDGDWHAAIDEGVDVAWLEPLLNPTWDVLDLQSISDSVHAVGGTVFVDATASPLTTRPLRFGADVVVHSGSKAYNGHSDAHAGLVIAGSAGEWWEQLHRLRALMGTILQPWDAWLLGRGMRTMPLRVDRASDTALRLAERLGDHPAVARVRYPGIVTHPGHSIARRQMERGFGSLLSVDVADFATASRVVEAVDVWVPATSFGGIESLIEHRATVEPPGSPVPRGLLRLSVGLEPLELLWEDLDRALRA